MHRFTAEQRSIIEGALFDVESKARRLIEEAETEEERNHFRDYMNQINVIRNNVHLFNKIDNKIDM